MLDKSKLPDLIKALAKDHTVYGPVKGDDGVTLSALKEGSTVCLDFSNTTMSSKELFFPQCEVMCTFADGQVKDVPEPDGKMVVLGMRPCDADAVAEFDHVFGDAATGFSDPYFLKRRENTVIIALACDNPCTTCFCTSVGSGPYSENGADILTFQDGSGLIFVSCTDKGEALMKANESLFTGAAEANKKKMANALASSQKLAKVETGGLSDKLGKGFYMKAWDGMFDRCLGCGACTYVCPTCHCFDIVDEADENGDGQRVRAWDACQFALFTHHTSGHNPRPGKKERMRQRLMHKFSYAVENFKETFCVGCGRCVRSCPVNLDIREMIDTLQAWEEPGN
ncbi:4Fe-4S dicluster domain-containing protein [Planctomycetota bacterium]